MIFCRVYTRYVAVHVRTVFNLINEYNFNFIIKYLYTRKN